MVDQIYSALLDDNDETDEVDEEFPPVSTLLQQAAKPAKKIVGSRRANAAVIPAKVKGKGHAIDEAAPTSCKRKSLSATPATEVTKKSVHGGRQQGAPNYNEEDISALLTACEEHLPVGAKSWSAVEMTFGQ